MEIKFTNLLFYFKKSILQTIMRSFIFLFCIVSFGFTPNSSNAQRAKITINSNSELAINEVFELIREQTDYTFVYTSDLFKNTPNVPLEKGTIKTDVLLDKCLLNTVFTYDFVNESTILLKRKPEFKGTELVMIPQQTITGTVRDVNGNGLPGVNVLVGKKGSKVVRGVATEFNGTYSIIAAKGEAITFSYLGYITQEVIVNNQSKIDIVLKENTSRLNEVIVVGYGTTQKKDLTGSVSTIRAAEVELLKSQTAERALYGKVPGVMITGTGEPGSGASVNIRGLSQINGDNQPLYVIDGIPMTINSNSREQSGLLSSGSSTNPLLSINPSDIENMTVLKDASAAAIYGSRAANGVIIVTTKRGKRGQKPRFTFSVNSTIQNPQTRYEFLSTEEFKQFYTDQAQIALDNTTLPDFLIPVYMASQYNIVNDPDSHFGTADTDWQDEIQNKNALWMDYRFGLSGGTENVNYYVSGNVQNQEAVFIGNKFKRYSFASNIDATVTDRLKIGASLNYNNTINKSNELTSFRYAGAFRPDVPVFDEDGNYATGNYKAFGVIPDMNPVGQEGRNDYNLIGKNILASVYAELDVAKNLKFRSTFSANQSNDEVKRFSPSFTTDAYLDALNGDLISYGGDPIGILHTQFNKTKNIIFSNTLTYNNTFNDKHTINAVAGISWDTTENEVLGASFGGFPDDFVLINAGSATHIFNGNSDFAQKGLNSVFGRVNYNYDDKYLATVTARADKSTQFGEDNNTGIFPSLGLAWNMHNEDFLKDHSTINVLKLRASAGRTGNDNLPAFLFQPVMAVESGYGSPTLYNGLNGFRLQGVSNNEIRWEQTDQIDLAVELGLFNNRLNAEVVWFSKNTSDLILLTPISAQTGFSSIYTNVADMDNSGWEFQVGGDIIRTVDFTWNSSFNVSMIENEVKDLKGGTSDSYNNYGVVEGYPLGTVFGYDIVKTADTQAEIDVLNASAPDGEYSTFLRAPGDYIQKDTNGDGEITDDDQRALADGNTPDFFGGWNNTFSYKNFDLSVNFQFVQGIDKIRSPDEFLSYINFDRMQNYIKDDVANSWSPTNLNSKYLIFLQKRLQS